MRDAKLIPAHVSLGRRLFFVALTVGLVLSSRLSSAQDVATEDVANEWPALRLGIWESVSRRVLPSGKTKTWKARLPVCHHARSIFWGYWGLKQVGIGGCAWESKKLSDSTYRLRTRCDVKGGGNSEGLLTVTSQDAYELTITTKEGKQVTRGSATGHRVGDCERKKGAEGHDE